MNCCLPLSGKNVTVSTLDVEFKIPDSCNECERAMTGVISNFKGVESWDTDIENETIAVSGSFNMEKLLKKLTKATHKEVEFVKKEEKDAESEMVQEIVENDEKPEEVIEPNSDEYIDLEKLIMFSEENPNARCTIS